MQISASAAQSEKGEKDDSYMTGSGVQKGIYDPEYIIIILHGNPTLQLPPREHMRVSLLL